MNNSFFSLPRLLLIYFVFCHLIFAGISLAGDQKPIAWKTALKQSKGQTVDWYMWGGSPAVNKYVNGYLAQELKKRYDIELRQVPVKDISEIVTKLLVEKQAGKESDGAVDLMWINGENFRTCKSNNLLYGPFSQLLPNGEFVDWAKPSLKNDFGTPVERMESPWGSSQMVMIYDSARTPKPPRTVAGLLQWIKEHPGKFTYPAPPDFTGSAFLRHIFYHAAGPDSDTVLQSLEQGKLENAANTTFALLRDLSPSLWRQGSTYPDSPVRLNNLFVDGEIDFSFSYNQGEASRNIKDGLFPKTVRTYVFDEGTLANTHFVAIPFNAADKAAAMVVANFLLSPEAQLHKADPEIWGDFPVINPELLPKTPTDWSEKFLTLPRGEATLSPQELQRHQLPEPPAKVLAYLEKGWLEHVLKNH